MGVQFHADFDPFDDVFGRLSHWPDMRTVRRLNAILDDQFLATQRDVHVITESLRRSGEHDSDIGRTDWVGEIRYGGPSAGSVHNPVKYARYEMHRGAGTSEGTTFEGEVNENHDFMRATRYARYRRRYLAAIRDHFKGAQ